MPVVTFKPNGILVNVPNNSSLLNAAKLAGISVETPCGGNGVCGRCLVKIEAGKVDFFNNGILSDEMLNEGLVLICKTKVLDEPVSVQIIAHLETERGKFSVMAEDMMLISKALLPSNSQIEPIVKKLFLKVPAPNMGDGLADLDRLRKAVLVPINAQDIEIAFSLLKNLPEVLREANGEVTINYFEKGNIVSIVDIEANDKTQEQYGVAIDIGTTTIAVLLVSLPKGDIIASKTSYNAQIECGLDVISRINYASKPQRLEELRTKVLETINGIIGELSADNGIDMLSIYNASIAGNTTMVHLLLGIVPQYIRLEPYTPAVFKVPLFTANEVGLDICPNTCVFIAPSVGSYVGADITSGILCTSLATNSSEVCLFIDIGTNGELVLGNDDFLLGCACSAGPAFEGGGIENGMRASLGAIERVEIDKETGEATFSTIGNVPPIGICGSGMISLIAGLFSTGRIDAGGKLNRAKPCTAIDANAKNAKYIIASAELCKNNKAIYITEADIDNLIRAKAAIFSACRVLLHNVNMDFSDLSRLYIAGGFGRYLDIEKSKTIGLIPDLSAEKFIFIGNSSIIGAYMTLLSKTHREKQQELAQKITYIDLSTEAGYMDQYTAALFLPHTDFNLFKNIHKETN